MEYRSTRGGAPVAFEEAIMSGTAPDGGLFVPASLPAFAPEDFGGEDGFPGIAARLLAPFVAGSTLAGSLEEVCREALDFPVPTRQ
jgi:threonine synthase